jgi:hypothetical protein
VTAAEPCASPCTAKAATPTYRITTRASSRPRRAGLVHAEGRGANRPSGRHALAKDEPLATVAAEPCSASSTAKTSASTRESPRAWSQLYRLVSQKCSGDVRS